MQDVIDFFISYTSKDGPWAEWIAWALEDAGYRTFLQAWDFTAAANFVLQMHRGAAESSRTIAVLSPEYFKSTFTAPEWAVAFSHDPSSTNQKLIPIRVADFDPPGLFKAVVYIDLVNLDEVTAKTKLLDRISVITQSGRQKPKHPPSFPGTTTAHRAAPFPGAPAPRQFLHNLPFPTNPFFTGREALMQTLRQSLQNDASTAITQPQAIHGLGGVGKTQLAIEYAWHYRASYNFALWAEAPSVPSLYASISALAALLGLPEPVGKEEHAKFLAVVSWLRANREWLLILDNVDTQEVQAVISENFPPGLQGNIIVTSRRTDWPIGFGSVEVPVLPDSAAQDFLLKRSKRPDPNEVEKTDAAAVAEELGYLPLALEQAGAYTLKHRITFADYRKLLVQSRTRLLTFPSQGGTGYQRTVATTWFISEQRLGLAARVILQLTAFLSPFDIPRTLFAKNTKLLREVAVQIMEVPAEKADDLFAQAAIEDATAELNEHSLIQLDPQVFSCHRLLQAVLRDRLDPGTELENWLEAAAALLAEEAKSSPTVKLWPHWAHIRPQIESFLRHVAEHETVSRVPFLMAQLASFYATIGAYSEAEPLLRRAIELTQRNTDEDTLLPRFRFMLADLLADKAKFDEAEALCRDLLESYDEENDTAESPVLLLARLLLGRDRFAEAELLYTDALKSAEVRRESHPLYYISAINGLANLLTTTGRKVEAENLFRRCLKLLEESDALRDSPSVGTLLGNLASCLHERGLLDRRNDLLNEASALYRRALKFSESNFGPNHPIVAKDANNLGWFLHDVGQFAEAEPLLRRSLAIDESIKGSNHPDIGTSLNNLGRLLTSTKRFVEAKHVLERAVAIRMTSVGEHHHDYATGLTNLASALCGCGEFAEAEKCLRRSLEIDEKSFGKRHVEVGMDLWNLAALLMNSKKYLEAEGYLRRAVKIFQQALGKNHTRTKEVQKTLQLAQVARGLK